MFVNADGFQISKPLRRRNCSSPKKKLLNKLKWTVQVKRMRKMRRM
jgi:hypothetical protein